MVTPGADAPACPRRPTCVPGCYLFIRYLFIRDVLDFGGTTSTPPLRSVVIMNVLVDDDVEAIIRDNSGSRLGFLEPRGFTPGDLS
jgi:hypothetical protein